MSDFLKPTTKGMRGPLDNGNPSGKIDNPPRMAQLGGLTSTSKIRKGSKGMTVRKPGSGS